MSNPFNIDYETKIGDDISKVLAFFTTITDPEHFELLSDYLINEADKYAMTDGYQTKGLRELCMKNFRWRFNMLKIASILGKRSDVELIIRKAAESKQYSCESYEAFLAVDEEAGKKYSLAEEQEIKTFFTDQLEYINRLLSFEGLM